MRCRICGQDVPDIPSLDGKGYSCAPCAAASPLSPQSTTASHSAYDLQGDNARLAGVAAQQPPLYDSWEIDAEFRHIGWLLGRASVSGGDYDYRNWCPSTFLVRELGCHRAYSFEIRNGCAGGVLACNVVAGMMDRDPSVNNALVVCADTLSRIVSAEIPQCQPLLYFGDGAAAVVLRRDHPRYQLLSFAEHTDGELGDLLRIDAGGTRLPFTKEFTDWERAYARVDAEVFADLMNRVYLKEYVSVINRAVERCGHTLAEMEFILMNQVKVSLRQHILDTIGMPQDHTYISLDEYGHMGPADSLFTLAMAHRQGLLPAGKLAVLAASGLGFSWVASVLRC